MTWIKLPQEKSTSDLLRILVDSSPTSSFNWPFGHRSAVAWLNINTGSLVAVYGVGELAGEGFVRAEIRVAGLKDVVPLPYAPDNRYVATNSSFTTGATEFEERFAEIVDVTARELGLRT